MTSADIWDPSVYLRWTKPRSRGVTDLIDRVDHPAPRRIVDLGCGPGNNTELIADRWPEAVVTGIDNSPSMIEAARPRARPGRLEFLVGDLRDWAPGEPPDMVLANAVLQFIPDHLGLLRGWAGYLAPGGVLGVQMPGSPPAQGRDSIMEIARELIETPAWRDLLGGSLENVHMYPPEDYLTTLGDAGLDAEAWETVYSFPLAGPGSLADYAAGSLIRPALARLDGQDRERFIGEYTVLLRERQPPRMIGGQATEILRQRRVFGLGRRRLL
jgi:trans-aconitate 2-methyltransferase